MGRILADVKSGHLSKASEEEATVCPFLNGFDLTWAKKRKAANTWLSVYFLKPEQCMAQSFGFENEIMLVYSAYDSLEPRVIQATEQLLADSPAKGRVDTMTVFLVSESENPEAWMRQYISANPDSKIFAAFQAEGLRQSRGDSNYVLNRLAEQLYRRDLFDHRLPLRNDSYFFGREDIVFDMFNAIRNGENRGLFGLRKTGKTSLLYKIERRISAAKAGTFFYYDCKFPGLRTLHWETLLNRIAEDIIKNVPGMPQRLRSKNAADRFLEMASNLSKSERLVLAFDEIEYISPYSKLDDHWVSEFVPFWQTIWASQSRYRNISLIVAGVNPSVVERDAIEGTQNPLFGIVPSKYLQGLSSDEVRNMLRILGRPMGITFDDNAQNYLLSRYGGHPLLTRIACSLTHHSTHKDGLERPIAVDSDYLLDHESARDAELSFYCRHVVSELQEFYPNEYDLLEKMACGEIAEYVEFTMFPEFTTHLENYGLLSRSDSGKPQISIPVLARYLGLEVARREGRKTLMRVVPHPERKDWLERRVKSIDHNFDLLQRAISSTSGCEIFGPNSYPESHRFFGISVCAQEDEFANFINICNRCFVESIETYGKSINAQNYFWNTLPKNYPALSEALHRIKLYRHHRVHLKLNPGVERALSDFLSQDLEGRNPAGVEDLWFVLQQCVLDGLLTALLVEIERLSP
jgi:hypothetical protein